MTDLKDMKAEADQLGIKYSPNIGEAKLQEKIDAFYEAQETSSQELEAAIEAKKTEPSEQLDLGSGKASWNDTKRRRLAKEREAAARKTKIITIIDNDQRVNNQTTTCTVNCSNAMFDLGQIILPLNMDVEVMQGHIEVLKRVEIPQHIKDPKSGMSSYQLRPRYTISYSEKQPK